MWTNGKGRYRKGRSDGGRRWEKGQGNGTKAWEGVLLEKESNILAKDDGMNLRCILYLIRIPRQEKL